MRREGEKEREIDRYIDRLIWKRFIEEIVPYLVFIG